MSVYLSEFLCCAPQEMLRGVVKAAREVTRGEWELGAWLLAIHRSRAYEKAGFRSAVGFAIRRAGLEPHKASNLLRIAQALERLPVLAAAYQAGRVGYAKIREITRVAEPETDESWLEYALSHTTDQVRHKLSCSSRTYELRAASGRQDGLLPIGTDCSDSQTSASEVGSPGRERGSQTAATTLIAQPSTGALSTLSAPSTPCTAATCEGSLFQATEQSSVPGPHFVHVAMDFTPEEYAEWQSSRERLSRQFGRRLSQKEVVLELIRRHLATAPRSELARNPVVVRLETDGQSFLETDRGRLPISPERGQDYLTRASSVVVKNVPGQPEVVRNVPGQPEELSEEAALSVLILNRGRRRKLPADLIRALIARSGGRCESCGRGGVLHAHHRKPVARGGAHTLDNLALLCVSCHGHTHEKDFKTGSPWAQARDRRRKSKTQQGSRRGRHSQPSTPNSS